MEMNARPVTWEKTYAKRVKKPTEKFMSIRVGERNVNFLSQFAAIY